MPNRTAISWCDMTSNPIYAVDKETGKRGWYCTKVSEGCQNCYAEKRNKRFGHGLAFTEANRERVEWRLNEKELAAIMGRKTPTRIFMMDMGDPFYEDVPDEFLDRVWATMALAEQHTFLVLTKRPERMRDYLGQKQIVARIDVNAAAIVAGRSPADVDVQGFVASVQGDSDYHPLWPLPSVWLGVTTENQPCADERIPILLDTPAAHYFVSCEPLLGPLDLTHINLGVKTTQGYGDRRIEWDALTSWEHQYQPGRKAETPECSRNGQHPCLDFVIVGGESGGPPERALVERCISGSQRGTYRHSSDEAPCSNCHGTGWRPKPEALEWVRRIRDDCLVAGVGFHFKGWGGRTPESAGHLLDGQEHRAMLG